MLKQNSRILKTTQVLVIIAGFSRPVNFLLSFDQKAFDLLFWFLKGNILSINYKRFRQSL